MASKAARPEHPEDKRDKAAPADEVQPKFREALERKRAREAGAHGPAMNRRSFRRKSG